MDLSRLIERYVGRVVRVSTGSHKSYVGTLAAVHDDCIRLEQTLTVSDLEEDTWSQRMYAHDPELSGAYRDAETVIHLHAIGSVTCLEDDVPPPESSEAGTTIGTLDAALSSVVVTDRDSAETDASASNGEEEVASAVDRSRLCVELGCELIRLVDPARGGDLLDRIANIRSQIADELGFVVPKIRVRDNFRLPSTKYRVSLCGCTMASGELKPSQLLALLKDSDDECSIADPVFGHPARWINQEDRGNYELRNARVVEPAAVLATHLTTIIREHASKLLSHDAVQDMLNELRESAPQLVSDLVPNTVSVSLLHQLLIGLLEERVPIRQLGSVLESAGRHAGTVDSDTLLRRVRIECGHIVCSVHSSDLGVMQVVSMDDDAQQHLERLVDGDDLDRHETTKTIDSLKEQWHACVKSDNTPILVRNGKLRRWLWRKMNDREKSFIPVLSEDEVPDGIEVDSAGCLSLATPDQVRRPLPR